MGGRRDGDLIVANLIESPAWQALQKHYSEIEPQQMRDLFDADPERFERSDEDSN